MKLDHPQREALERLYHDTYYQLSAYAMSTLHNQALTEEAVQETFLIACTKASKVLESQNPVGWLMVALQYVLKRIWRRQKKYARETGLQEAADQAGGEAEPPLPLDLLYGSYLLGEEFDLLFRVGELGYTVREAASQLGLSEEACKKRVQRAKMKFRKRYLADC